MKDIKLVSTQREWLMIEAISPSMSHRGEMVYRNSAKPASSKVTA
ncbi:MAG TPA: hypothetical protein VFR18_16145 [Terriglobia bacterium]|nr:hypothetical protein [Terriglobia bacterium]